MAYYIQGAVMKDRGPVFVTTFNPLCMVIVAIMGSFFMPEQMYLGRTISGGVGLMVSLLSMPEKMSCRPPSPPASSDASAMRRMMEFVLQAMQQLNVALMQQRTIGL
ncbi:WAT1-related protein [Vigna angularis]|uniref:WAT1-related protein n=1 Tax=Phaseolus angularis TaxID=3914 RepID=A0A8T0JZ13_PHAAN|nr:WAT1-related protein [Vigna angularis]